MKLGKLEKITDLRSIWKHEAKDFTPWLAKEENIELLSEAIGIDIVLEERESNVGDFSVDLYATEDITGRKIIIENQLEESNHDHLGKIITYASGKDAEVIIWIVKKARDEHRKAIEWLNLHTDDKSAFFLIEIEVWRINDSEPAPKFNIVERPNDWAKAMKKNQNLSDSGTLQLEFWQGLKDFAEKDSLFTKSFKLRTPLAQNWYNLAAGSSAYHIDMTINTLKNVITTGIYIRDDKSIYESFKQFAADIEKEIGSPIVWREANKACRIYVTFQMDVKDRNEWNKGYAWLCSMDLKIKDIIRKYDKLNKA